MLRRGLVRQPDDPPAVGRDLDRHAFAHAAEAVQRVLGDELEVPGNRIVGGLLQRAIGNGHYWSLPLGTSRFLAMPGSMPGAHVFADFSEDVDGIAPRLVRGAPRLSACKSGKPDLQSQAR